MFISTYLSSNYISLFLNQAQKKSLFPGIELENMVKKVYMKMNVAYTSLAASRATNVDDQCR